MLGYHHAAGCSTTTDALERTRTAFEQLLDSSR